MSRLVILSICLLILSSFTCRPPSAAAADSLTAYELLEDYNFPAGLLPKGISRYDLDETTGKFHVYLNGTCSFSLEGSYDLKYKSTIGGYIEKNKLTGLTGISVKVLFLWLNIVEVRRSGDEIELSVGIASANFPVDNFVECPQCGCGLNCNNGQPTKDTDTVANVFVVLSFDEACL
ncbi:hypothetical protein L1049_004851 [Liquidambar formosana]|uniref:Uncharacterized protein n=1 Tax=Liquidambar formosana TaxID=63359 RepID=A0AAP0RTC1_LIQFO